MSTVTVRRDLLGLPRGDLLRRRDGTWSRVVDAQAALAALPDDASIGLFVDAYEAFRLAHREHCQVETALALDRARAPA